MGKIYERLMSDVRLQEGLKACINCGTCTAVCPAAEFYRYNPKNIVNIVQTQDDEEIIKLLKSAVANAENNFSMDPDKLVVTQVFATPGPILKRMMPRAQGRAYRINKRTSHVTLAVAERD